MPSTPSSTSTRRSSRRTRAIAKVADDDADADANAMPPPLPVPSSSSQSSPTSSRRTSRSTPPPASGRSRRRKIIEHEDEELAPEEDLTTTATSRGASEGGAAVACPFRLSQQLPEHISYTQDDDGEGPPSHEELLSQPVVARPIERANMEKIGRADRERLVKAMARYMLFKGFRSEAIVKSKAVSDVLADYRDTRIAGAIVEDAASLLASTYGFHVSGPPHWMLPGLPNKYKDRLYVTNPLRDEDGQHSRSLHDNSTAGDRGLLMTILALAYCKGVPNARLGTGIHGGRWITAEQLYRYLHDIDPIIPEEAPRISKGAGGMGSPEKRGPMAGSVPAGLSGPVHVLLDDFVARDYLMREKMHDDDAGFGYAMGPRAVMEVGREQLITFCAEMMDEEPDPVMLAEIHGAETTQGEEEEEDGEED